MDLTRQWKNSGMKNSDYWNFQYSAYRSSNSSCCNVFLLIVVVVYIKIEIKRGKDSSSSLLYVRSLNSLVKSLHVSKEKGQPGALKLPTPQGPIGQSLTLYFCQRPFPRVRYRSHII